MEAKEVIQILNAKLEKVPKAEVRSMGLEVLPRLIDVLHHQKDTCPDCRMLHDEGVSHIEDIIALFGQDLAIQKKFENWVSKTQSHLKHQHGMVAKGRTAAAYIFTGIAVGVIIGALVMYLTENENVLRGAILGWVVGMLIGWSIGKIKENKLQKKHHLY